MTTNIGPIGGNYITRNLNAINERCERTNLSEEEVKTLCDDIHELYHKKQDVYRLLKKIYKNNPENYMKLLDAILYRFMTGTKYQDKVFLHLLCAPLLHKDCNISVMKKNKLEIALRNIFPKIFDGYLREINQQDYENIRIPRTAMRLENWNRVQPIICTFREGGSRIMLNVDERDAAIREKYLAQRIYFQETRARMHEERIARLQNMFPLFPSESDQRNNSINNNNMTEPDNNIIHNNRQQENVGNLQSINNSMNAMQVHSNISNTDRNGFMQTGNGSGTEENRSGLETRIEEDWTPVSQETGPVTEPGSDYDSDEDVLFEDPPRKDRNENKN